MTPARRHFLMASAAAAAGTLATTAAPAPIQTRMLALLERHKVALKAIKSRKAKIDAKRGFLPEYEGYIAGILAADAGGSDQVVVTVMVWAIDVGEYGPALRIAAYAIRHRLELPPAFKRDLQTTLLDEIADPLLAQLATAEPISAGAVDALQQALDLTSAADMPDEVRAKAWKAVGLLRRDTDPAAALQALRTALSFDGGCGVKTDIGRLERQLGGAGAAPGPSDPAGAAATD